MIDESIKHYLHVRLQQLDTLQPQAQSALASDQVHHNIPSPTRAPPPPPNLTSPMRSKSVPNDAHHVSTDALKPIFRTLENYIFSCFSGADCLNASFLTSHHPVPARAMSESAVLEKTIDIRPEASFDASDPFPDFDAKTLLLGDFAENGTWWTGKGAAGRQHLQRVDPRAQEEDVSTSVNPKSPCIDWRGLNEWYSTVCTAGKCFYALNFVTLRHRIKIYDTILISLGSPWAFHCPAIL